MPIVSRTAIVNYTADEMFRLVTDIEAYPQFVPWCASALVRESSDGVTVATLEIAKGPVRQAFTTRNLNSPPESIRMELVEGPFEHLEGMWTFVALNASGSRVSLEIDFKLKHSLLRAAFGKIFNLVASQMVDAFCQRAVVVYGKR